jgi:hypothetical protein
MDVVGRRRRTGSGSLQQLSGSVEATAAAGCGAARVAAAAARTAGGAPATAEAAAGDGSAAATEVGHGRSSLGSHCGRCREGTSPADPSPRGALKSNER